MGQKITFDQVIKVGCGCDVHKDTVVGTIRRSDTDYETRLFETYTSSLIELRECCKSRRGDAFCDVVQWCLLETGIQYPDRR